MWIRRETFCWIFFSFSHYLAENIIMKSSTVLCWKWYGSALKLWKKLQFFQGLCYQIDNPDFISIHYLAKKCASFITYFKLIETKTRILFCSATTWIPISCIRINIFHGHCRSHMCLWDHIPTPDEYKLKFDHWEFSLKSILHKYKSISFVEELPDLFRLHVVCSFHQRLKNIFIIKPYFFL